MRTAIAELVLKAAESVLREKAAGRSVDPHRLAWAQRMYLANTPVEKRDHELVKEQA